MESQVTSIEAGANGVDALQVLDKLESRIQGAIGRLRTAERERSEAEKEAARVKSLFAEKDSEIERLLAQASELRSERDEVRKRVEALLEKIETLAE
jgi:FtsZ-binding cell division protein ZapB